MRTATSQIGQLFNGIGIILMKLTLQYCLLIVILTFGLYYPALNHDFVNWDDDVHVTSNPYVHPLNIQQIKNIFTTTVCKTYIPLTTLSFSFEYYFFGAQPFVYHLNNIFLHIGVCLLIFIFGYQIGISQRAAFISALLFGIHPMHVESVAWVTERKDVLYSFFYMLSLVLYCFYIHKIKNEKENSKAYKIFILSLVCGLLSILSKPMALSLPLILCLYDWFIKRRLSKRLFLEKAYFFIFFIPITYVSYLENARIPASDVGKSILTWIWCFVFYLKKFFFPNNFVLLQRLPTLNIHHSGIYIIDSIIFIVFVTLVCFWRKNRLFIFASLFYFLSIFFLLRFDAAKDFNVVADRFMYLPSLGWCLFIGVFWDNILKFCNQKIWKKISVYTLSFICIFLLLVSTRKQIKVWKNSLTLWQHQLKINPHTGTALIYLKLAEGYMQQAEKNNFTKKEITHVLNLYQQAINIKPDFANAYWARGRLYLKLKEYERAEQSFHKAISFDPKHFEAYFDLGKLYYETGEKQKSVKTFQKALSILPDNVRMYDKIMRFYADKGKPLPFKVSVTQK